MPDLAQIYRRYLGCLNQQDWSALGTFVSPTAIHNGRALGLQGYRAMLETDFRDIPDLHFDAGLLVVERPHVAARLDFTCAPRGQFVGLPVNGRTVSFSENVFYRFDGDKIAEVWSVIDRAAIEAQL